MRRAPGGMLSDDEHILAKALLECNIETGIQLAKRFQSVSNVRFHGLGDLQTLLRKYVDTGMDFQMAHLLPDDKAHIVGICNKPIQAFTQALNLGLHPELFPRDKANGEIPHFTASPRMKEIWEKAPEGRLRLTTFSFTSRA